MNAKIPVGLCLLTAVYAHADTSPTITYWFDDSPLQTMPVSNGASSFEVDASMLAGGLHTLTVMVEGENGLSSAHSAFFVKPFNPSVTPGVRAIVLIDGAGVGSVPVTATANGASYTIDASTFPVGVHSLTSALVSPAGESTELSEALFLRVPMASEISAMHAYYIIDDDYNQIGKIKLEGQFPAYKLDVDVASLSTGIHTVTIFCASETGFSTTPMKSFFIKIPNGGEGIAAYEYWIDDSPAKTKVKLEKPEIPLTLVKLVDMPVAEFRSSNFELKMEGTAPVVYGKHTFNFMCYDGDYRTALGNREYVESRTPKEVSDITALTEKTGSKRTPTLQNQQIKWYGAQLHTGDSLALNASTACMIDVFTPKGERVYKVSGSESCRKGGFHAYEDGRYLIAVHDVVNKSNITDLTYQHIDKYEILKAGPKSTAAADMFILQLTGNGLEHLKEAKLTCGSETFEAVGVTNLGMGNATLQFNLTDAPNGTYALTAHYDNGKEPGDVELDNVLNVVDARPGEIRTSAARTVFGTTLNDVKLTITNTGNVPYWGVPLCFAAEADGSEDIKVNFKDFIPFMPGDADDEWSYVFTDNLLGTGRRGLYIPMVLPYIGPKETKELTIVYQMPLQVHIPTYAWAGRPWSDEFKELIALANEDKPFPIKNENYISATTLLLCEAVAEYNNGTGENAATQAKGMLHAPSGPIDYSHISDNVGLATQLGKHTNITTRPLTDANTIVQRSVGIGNTMGGIINGARLRNLDAYGIDLRDETYSSLLDYRNDLLYSMPNPHHIIDGNFNPLVASILKQLYGLDGNGGCAQITEPSPRAHDIVQLTSCDPNDITGYQDPSGGRFVGIDVTSIPYTIEFENDPALANAPAHVITVSDNLDPKVFDLTTFAMKEIEIGRKSVEIDGGADFNTTVDMRPEINAIADISFTLDKTTGRAEWTIRSLDPMTMETATEVEQGVLPINLNDDEGCGKILFDVNLKQGCESGMHFSNKATIVFDGNEPIETPAWDNVTDFTRPQTRITDVKTTDNKVFTFDTEEFDNESGLWKYNLYFRASDSADWTILKSGINPESLTYESEKELTGNFCVEATDKAGNVQTETPMSVLLGDADSNGIIEATDVVVIRNYYTGVNKSICKVAADINLDYAIDAQDGVETINRFLNGGGAKNVKHIRTRKAKR